MGTADVIELLTSGARTFIFDTALAPAAAGAALAALRIIQSEPELVANVRSHAGALQWAAGQIGWEVTNPAGAVISCSSATHMMRSRPQTSAHNTGCGSGVSARLRFPTVCHGFE